MRSRSSVVVIATASLAAFGSLGLAAQDRYTLKIPILTAIRSAHTDGGVHRARAALRCARGAEWLSFPKISSGRIRVMR